VHWVDVEGLTENLKEEMMDLPLPSSIISISIIFILTKNLEADLPGRSF
jgi:hypothetical protein